MWKKGNEKLTLYGRLDCLTKQDEVHDVKVQESRGYTQRLRNSFKLEIRTSGALRYCVDYLDQLAG